MDGRNCKVSPPHNDPTQTDKQTTNPPPTKQPTNGQTTKQTNGRRRKQERKRRRGNERRAKDWDKKGEMVLSLAVDGDGR
jgi:hypothetical protein